MEERIEPAGPSYSALGLTELPCCFSKEANQYHPIVDQDPQFLGQLSAILLVLTESINWLLVSTSSINYEY